MPKLRPTVVRIENARPGEAKYTTPKKAHYHCKRGVAQWVSPTCIKFLSSAEQDRLAPSRIEWDREQSILRERKGVIFWNGCDTSKGACHLPFTGPDFPRPGSGSPSSTRLWADRLPAHA